VESGGKVNLAVGISLTLISSICWGIASPFSWMAQHDGDGVGGDEQRPRPDTASMPTGSRRLEKSPR
jgi:hypothetical protein